MLKMKNFLRKALVLTGDSIFNRTQYYYLHKKLGIKPKKINLISPVGFSEKIIWLKTRFRHPEAMTIADKVTAKNFAAQIIGDKHIIPTLATYNHPDKIKYLELPRSFVIKANHGSGWNILVQDKDNIDKSKIHDQTLNWLKCNYYSIGREYQYKWIKPTIIIEKLLGTPDAPLRDYKFFCFNGIPKFIQLDVDRFSAHKRNFYDLNWKLLPLTILYPAYKGTISKPSTLNEMIEIAKKLSSKFPFVRVDLYESNNQVYFGELTLHPGGGFEPIMPETWDKKIGDFLSLPET